jgi:hypothetical protein
MDGENIMRASQAIASVSIIMLTSFNVCADYTVDKGPIHANSPQDIVLTLSQDPTMKPEVACLALTFGQFLRTSSKKVNVTLFLKNDGVGLADAATVSSVTEPCQTPQGAVTLEDNLKAFLAGNNNNMVNCPLCWGARFGVQAPAYGILDSSAITPLFLNAEKILDF